MVTFHLKTADVSPVELLDLPWSDRLDEWPADQTVRLPRGVHRHPVVFVERGGTFLALKEMSDRLVHHEYEMLGRMADSKLPVVDVVGLAHQRRSSNGDPLDAVLITAHLRYSLPYRSLFVGQVVPDIHEKLIDALAVLVVRMHLQGFFWGDCSLNNALFRRDAGALSAWIVDVETSEVHDTLTAGQRNHDIEIASENLAGGMFDLQAAGRLDAGVDPIVLIEGFQARYDKLWTELTATEVVGTDELWRIHSRLSRLNELGFDTAEVDLVDDGDQNRIVFRPVVVEEGHHRRQLLGLVGIEASENQARRLLSAIQGYRAWLSAQLGRELPEAVAAYRWLTERWEPTMAAIPTSMSRRLEAPEIYHQVLEHSWFLSEQAGEDVGLDVAVKSYVDRVLAKTPDERVVLEQNPTGQITI